MGLAAPSVEIPELLELDRDRERAKRVRLELELDDLELELGLDRDLGLPLRGAPGGDDGLLDPMSLPGAADDLDGLLDDDLDGLLALNPSGPSTFGQGIVNPGGKCSRTVAKS